MNYKSTFLTVLTILFIALTTFHCGKDREEPLPPAPPPAPPKPGVISGRVSNEFGSPLAGAVVAIQGNGVNSSVQTVEGRYSFASLAAGSYNLLVKKEGYIETSASISVSAGDTTGKDFTLKAGTAYFQLLSDTLIQAHAFAAPYKIKVASNMRWSLKSENTWIVPEKEESNGEDSVVVRVTASLSDTTREGTLVLQAGSIVKNIIIRQVADVKLRASLPLPGNIAQGKIDSIALTFNQPVTITSVYAGYTYCQSVIGFTYSGNRVTFSYACAAMGGDYPFTITTVNNLGDQYTFTVNVGFYKKALNITGSIISHFANDADNSYWILTNHPNALYKIDMESLAILHRYDLPNEPVAFTVSPYDNRIYLSYLRIPKLYIMNQSGATEKVIDITRDTSRHLYEYNGPYIYPVRIAFTKSGKGIVWIADQYGYGSSLFWFIDAADGHKIWYQPLPGEAVGYEDAKANYDQTKLVLKYSGQIPTIGIFDPLQMKFTSHSPSTPNTGNVIVMPSRKNELIYSGQVYSQVIINPQTGSESPQMDIRNLTVRSMDFCYQPGREQTIYSTVEGKLQVVDHASRSIPVIHDAPYYAKGVTATLDGKYLIFTSHDGNYNTKVIQVPTTWLDY